MFNDGSYNGFRIWRRSFSLDNQRLDVFGASVISRRHRVLCHLGLTFYYFRKRKRGSRNRRNEITNFRQLTDESFFEAWKLYKLLIDRCSSHNMLPVTQIDTFYNGLTLRHRGTINITAGGTFMKRRPEECSNLIENMTTHHNDWDTSAQRKINKNLMRVLQVNQQVKVVTPNCKTCGGPPFYNDCPAIVGQIQNVYVTGAYQGAIHGQNPPPAYQAPAYQASGYQALVHQPPIPQPQVVTTNEFTNFMKENDAIFKNMQTNMTSLTNSNLELKNMFGQFMKMTTASSLGSGTLPEVDTFLALEDDPTSPKVDQSYVDTEGDILLLEAFLNDDPSLPPQNQGNYLPQVQKELKICEAKSDKSSIDEPPEVELKDLPPHLEYTFLEGDDKLQVIIAKDLSVEEKTALIMVLKLHKRAIAWKLSDIKGWRVCIDYQKLNEATRKDHFPLSFMDQMLERLARNE
nr:reverse transcriptase domain-containing protein [Tanacetum cinerariifolium]